MLDRIKMAVMMDRLESSSMWERVGTRSNPLWLGVSIIIHHFRSHSCY